MKYIYFYILYGMIQAIKFFGFITPKTSLLHQLCSAVCERETCTCGVVSLQVAGCSSGVCGEPHHLVHGSLRRHSEELREGAPPDDLGWAGGTFHQLRLAGEREREGGERGVFLFSVVEMVEQRKNGCVVSLPGLFTTTVSTVYSQCNLHNTGNYCHSVVPSCEKSPPNPITILSYVEKQPNHLML